jgi:hypothetical protein
VATFVLGPRAFAEATWGRSFRKPLTNAVDGSAREETGANDVLVSDLSAANRFREEDVNLRVPALVTPVRERPRLRAGLDGLPSWGMARRGSLAPALIEIAPTQSPSAG